MNETQFLPIGTNTVPRVTVTCNHDVEQNNSARNSCVTESGRVTFR